MSLGYDFKPARQSFHLAVGQGTQIHVEEYGNENGVPVVVCHGGPGNGLVPAMSRLFNPHKYRIILFSQRGCGLSSPDSLENNTPNNLVSDINILLNHLGIQQCVLAGGSWGASLSLLFYHIYPEKVSGLILWASFLAETNDLAWIYGPNGAGAQFYPELYQEFSLGCKSETDILAQYLYVLNGKDELEQHKVAQLWMSWESQLAMRTQTRISSQPSACSKTQQAKIMCHYFQPKLFSQLANISLFNKTLCKLPCWLIHSRDDLICRYSLAQRFAQAHNAQFYILENAGHAHKENEYINAITRASDLMLCRLF